VESAADVDGHGKRHLSFPQEHFPEQVDRFSTENATNWKKLERISVQR